jgi:cholera toxin transcriptional activator
VDPVLKYKFDHFEADLKAAELRRNGTRVKLQMQPFQLLVALLERPGDVVARDELRQRLWPEDTFVDFDHSLNTAIAKLRDVLGDSAVNPRYIETIAKRGYRFLAEVNVVRQQPAIADSIPAIERPQAPPAVATLPEPPQGATSELPRASRRTARLLFALSQLMYMAFYLSALFSLDRLYESAANAWQHAGHVVFVVYLVTAMVGVAVRLYLITATAFDYHLLGRKYRQILPVLFVLDMLWALAPFLIANRIGLGLALGASAALIYMPFAQRVLMKMIESSTSR